MRFMMLAKADKDYEAGQPPDPKLVAVIGQHGEELIRKGVMLEMEIRQLFDPSDRPQEEGARDVR